MAKFLRKALGLFVEFNDNDSPATDPAPSHTETQTTLQNLNKAINTNYAPPANNYTPPVQNTQNYQMHNDDLEKFEAHFEQVMEQANLPGPDYYEFCKMMEALEKAVPDEKTRIAAVYASLTVQGMNLAHLVDSAEKYKAVLDADKQNFEGALNQKSNSDVESKKQRSADLEKKIAANSEMIQKLTKEITDSQIEIGKLSQDINEAESKLQNNQRCYTLAYQAMVNKINVDIRNIQTVIK